MTMLDNVSQIGYLPFRGNCQKIPNADAPPDVQTQTKAHTCTHTHTQPSRYTHRHTHTQEHTHTHTHPQLDISAYGFCFLC